MGEEYHSAFADESVAELQKAEDLLRQIAQVLGYSSEDFLNGGAPSRVTDQERELLRLWSQIRSVEGRERVLAFARAEEMRTRTNPS